MSNIKTLVRGAYDIQKLRIQMGNRIVGNFKAKLGQEPSKPEAEIDAKGKMLLNQIRASYKKITDGKNVYFFGCSIYTGKVNPQKVKKEHQKFAWVDPNDLDMYHVSRDVEFTIRKAFGTNEFLMG